MTIDPEYDRVVRVMDEFSRAVHDRDLDGVMRLFCADEKTLLVGAGAGERAYGTDELRPFFEEMFGRAVRIGFRWNQKIVKIMGDVAWIFADGAISSSSEAGEHEHPYFMTGVLKKEGTEWLWILYHGSEPAG